MAGAVFSHDPASPAAVARIMSALTASPILQIGAGSGSFGAASGSTLTQDASSQIIAVLDGEIHNSAELRLVLCGGPASGTGDMIISAYRRWGESFPHHIQGDFAIAIWDSSENCLLLARNHIGSRPLCFWRSDQALLFASDPRGLLADSRVPHEPDEEHLAGFLSLVPEEGTRTFYRQIERVPPGCTVIARPGSSRIHRWWQPEQLPELRLRRHEDYAEALRCSLDEAVACRLPAGEPVAMALSSGLDSTSVAALAARRLAREGRRLNAFTLLFSAEDAGLSGPGWFANETPLASELARRYPNINHQIVAAPNVPLLDTIKEACSFRGTPLLTPLLQSAWAALYTEVARSRSGTLLTGGCGNMTISYDGRLRLGSLLRKGQIPSMFELMWGMRRQGIGWRKIVNQTLAPNLPPALHEAMRRLAGTTRTQGFNLCAVNPELARRTGVLDRMRQSGEGLVRAANGNFRAMCVSAINRRDRGPGIEAIRNRYGFTATSPTADRRVIELCVSIPEEQFVYKGQPRSLIRSAMAGILPAAILDERRRGRQGVGCQAALNAARQDIAREVQRMEASPLARRCLDVPRFRRLMDDWDDARVASSDRNSEYLQVLGRGIAAGQFLRRFEAP